MHKKQIVNKTKNRPKKKTRTKVWQAREFYLLLLPSALLILIFNYFPMYGIVIAFKNYKMSKGIWGSEWVGFQYFEQFFRSYRFWPIIRNTLVLSLYGLLVGFPLPVMIALICNQMYVAKFKKFFQVTTYLPHFISTVVMCGMILLFLSPSSGIIGHILSYFGIEMPNVMAKEKAFSHIYVWTDVWQHVGWNSILYVAALSSVDPTLYEAAKIDGASKWQRTKYIDLPMLSNTAVIMLILSFGGVMSLGFDKVYLLQNDMNIGTSEIISSYVYKTGLISMKFGMASAIGLFQTAINLSLLLFVNFIASNFSENALF